MFSFSYRSIFLSFPPSNLIKFLFSLLLIILFPTFSPCNLPAFPSYNFPSFQPSHLPPSHHAIFPASNLPSFSSSHLPTIPPTHRLTFPSSHFPTIPPFNLLTFHIFIYFIPNLIPIIFSYPHTFKFPATFPFTILSSSKRD